MLPQTVTVNTASALTGRSPQAIRKLIEDGVLMARGPGGSWLRIPLAAIEELTGRKVTAESYLAAQASLEKRRSYWRGYRRRERGSERVKRA